MGASVDCGEMAVGNKDRAVIFLFFFIKVLAFFLLTRMTRTTVIIETVENIFLLL